MNQQTKEQIQKIYDTLNLCIDLPYKCEKIHKDIYIEESREAMKKAIKITKNLLKTETTESTNKYFEQKLEKIINKAQYALNIINSPTEDKSLAKYYFREIILIAREIQQTNNPKTKLKQTLEKAIEILQEMEN